MFLKRRARRPGVAGAAPAFRRYPVAWLCVRRASCRLGKSCPRDLGSEIPRGGASGDQRYTLISIGGRLRRNLFSYHFPRARARPCSSCRKHGRAYLSPHSRARSPARPGSCDRY